MPAQVHVQFPAQILCHILREVIQFGAGCRFVFPFCIDGFEYLPCVSRAPLHFRIAPGNESVAGIPFVAVPDRSDIDEIDVVLAQTDSGHGIGAKGYDGVAAEANVGFVEGLGRPHFPKGVDHYFVGILLQHPDLHP